MARGRGLAAGATATETVKPVRTAELTTLVPWSQVPGLEDVSGIGRYTTQVDLGADWTDRDGAYLELGEVTDTFRVRVNGEPVRPVRPAAPARRPRRRCCAAAPTSSRSRWPPPCSTGCGP